MGHNLVYSLIKGSRKEFAVYRGITFPLNTGAATNGVVPDIDLDTKTLGTIQNGRQ